MCSSAQDGVGFNLRVYALVAIAAIFTGCAQVAVTPESPQPPDVQKDAQAMQAESVAPVDVEVRDFTFDTAGVRENGSPLNCGIDLFRKSTPDERRVGIGDAIASRISEQTAERLENIGLPAERVAADSDAPLYDNTLLITGRMTKINEGNGFTRVAIGFGAGESKLKTEVHVYRVMQGERAEVLAFTTYANSGRMPGVIWSMGFGELFLGPITFITAIDDAASSGQKFYASQIDYLAGETSVQIANYLSQYSADEGWIKPSNRKSVKLATSSLVASEMSAIW